MADDQQEVDQNEIEQLLKQAQQGEAETPLEQSGQQTASQGSTGVSQEESEATSGSAGSSLPPANTPAAGKSNSSADSEISQNDVEVLLAKAEEALASIDEPSGSDLPKGIKAFEFERFGGSAASTEKASLELMRDVQLDMTIELGRTHMYLEDVLQLQKGAVVALDKLAGDPADIFVNGRLIARGEVLVLNDNFCIRVAELIVGENA